MYWTRIKALIIKELFAILKDPKSRFILLGPPVLQLVVFSTAVTLDVRNINLVALNQDSGYYSTELLNRVRAATPMVEHLSLVENYSEIDNAIDQQRAIAAIIFLPDFSRRIERGEQASLQIILDGRKSNTSQIAFGYLNEIIAGMSPKRLPTTTSANAPIVVKTQYRYNSNLIFQWFMVSNLVASIAMLMGVIITALSIARERENGTFDQLLVSPLEPYEILIGKIIPPMIIGFIQLIIFILAALLVFSLPLRGTLLALLASATVFLSSVAGIGLFISALVRTQQQAILGAFLFLAPAMLLSGFATPVENIPGWLQPLTWIDPLRYFIVIVRGVLLKDMSFHEIALQTLPMAMIAAIAMALAALLFRKRTG